MINKPPETGTLCTLEVKAIIGAEVRFDKRTGVCVAMGEPSNVGFISVGGVYVEVIGAIELLFPHATTVIATTIVNEKSNIFETISTL